MAKKKVDWRKCQHQWGPEERRIVEQAFGVCFGLRKECQLCGAIWHDDWTALRFGSVERILPPLTHKLKGEDNE